MNLPKYINCDSCGIANLVIGELRDLVIRFGTPAHYICLGIIYNVTHS